MTLANQGPLIGAHYPIQPGGDMLEAINLWEQQSQRRMDIVNHYRKMGAPSGVFDNARISLQQAGGQGRIPLITWMPCGDDMQAGDYTLPAIANGRHDTYLRSWATGLRELGAPVHIRFGHEMNGSWYPWSGDPEQYVRAWRHIVTLFHAEGAENVKWVWCVNTSDQPKGNVLENYWPGEAWVDVLGIDGYNNYGGWRSFSQILRPAYDRVCRLAKDLPVWICETGTAEGGPPWPGTDYTSKAAWIADLFTTTGMPRVQALCWFDQHNKDSYDWRLDSSARALHEWRAQLRGTTFHVPPPGPYVPPTPDRVIADYVAGGTIRVAWRQIPAFHRGCRIRAVDITGHTMETTVLKPNTTARMVGLHTGPNTISVASFTAVRMSRPSTPVTVDVEEPY